MGLRVGAYERISDDKEEEARGVARQAADNEALASLRGWKIAEHYQDNDVSAFKENIVRPSFERLLADLEAGVLDGVVVYNQDRFVRQPSDLERAIRVYDRAKAPGVNSCLPRSPGIWTSARMTGSLWPASWWPSPTRP